MIVKLIKDNYDYFLHIFKWCDCGLCSCGCCKCDFIKRGKLINSDNHKLKFKVGMQTMYKSQFRAQ